MKAIVCPQCNGTEFEVKSGKRVCLYCGTEFVVTKDDFGAKESNIQINSDVEALLEKCRANPRLARRYANLVLDIDPNNEEAKMYL